MTWVTPAFFQKAISWRQSSGVPMPGDTQTSSPTDAGSRPSARISLCSLSKALSASSPAGHASGMKPSPYFAVRRKVASA